MTTNLKQPPSQPEHQAGPQDAKNGDAAGVPWDPGAVQALIDEAYRRGDTPVALCLGRQQTRALEDYLSHNFNGEKICLRGFVYAGLKIITLRPDSLLRLETRRTLRDPGRHSRRLTAEL